MDKMLGWALAAGALYFVWSKHAPATAPGASASGGSGPVNPEAGMGLVSQLPPATGLATPSPVAPPAPAPTPIATPSTGLYPTATTTTGPTPVTGPAATVTPTTAPPAIPVPGQSVIPYAVTAPPLHVDGLTLKAAGAAFAHSGWTVKRGTDITVSLSLTNASHATQPLQINMVWRRADGVVGAQWASAVFHMVAGANAIYGKNFPGAGSFAQPGTYHAYLHLTVGGVTEVSDTTPVAGWDITIS